MAFAMPHPSTTKPITSDVIEDVLSDPYQTVMLLVAKRARGGLLSSELRSRVKSIAQQADLAVEDKELRNRLRGLIKRQLLVDDGGGVVRLTEFGRRVAEAIAQQ